MADPKRFSLGVNYVLRDNTTGADTDRDLGRMADIGLDTVLVLIPWLELQTRMDAIASPVLDRLDTFIARAAENGLRVLPALAGTLDGEDLLPPWARALPNFYSEAFLEPQIALSNAVAERLQPYGATIVAWDVGHEFSRVRPPRAGKITTGEHGSAPVSEQEVAAWAKAVAQPLRDARVPVTAGTWIGDVTADVNVRFGSLCVPFAFASMQCPTQRLPYARGTADPEGIPFAAMLTTAFSFKPVLMTAVGCEHDDAHGSLASAVLHRLHDDGRLGAYWWRWQDDERGIVRSDGTANPVAAVLSQFAKTSPTVQRASDMPMISSTYYYRTLPESMTSLYNAYLSFIEDRRLAL